MATASEMSLSQSSPRSVREKLDELRGCSRDDDLATVRHGSNASAEVDVVSDVSLIGQQWGPRVETYPHLDRPDAGVRER